jgi:regulator of protease activity HflC (stomatin/prohibitin superfamily)
MEQLIPKDHDLPRDGSVPPSGPVPVDDGPPPLRPPSPFPGGGDFLRRLPLRNLAVALAIALALIVATRWVSGSLREVAPGEAGIAVSITSGRVRVLPPGTHFLPKGLYTLHTIRVSDQLLSGPDLCVTVSSKDGLAVVLSLQARWAFDARQLAARWSSLPDDPAREVVAPVLASSLRAVAPSYDALTIRAEKREELAAQAVVRASRRLAENGIVLRDVAIADVHLPPEFEQGRLAILQQTQEADRTEALLKVKAKQVDQGRLEAEAEKVKKEKAAEAEASQKLIAAKAESDAMQYILPLKEKAIEQQKLEAEADRARKMKEAQTAAETGKIETEAEAQKRRTLADAEAYAIRTTSAAQFENLKREVELVQANPVWVSKTFAERISDKVQVILTPQLSSNVFTDEVLKRVANGKPAVAVREAAPVASSTSSAPATTAAPPPTPKPAPDDPQDATN